MEGDSILKGGYNVQCFLPSKHETLLVTKLVWKRWNKLNAPEIYSMNIDHNINLFKTLNGISYFITTFELCILYRQPIFTNFIFCHLIFFIYWFIFILVQNCSMGTYRWVNVLVFLFYFKLSNDKIKKHVQIFICKVYAPKHGSKFHYYSVLAGLPVKLLVQRSTIINFSCYVHFVMGNMFKQNNMQICEQGNGNKFWIRANWGTYIFYKTWIKAELNEWIVLAPVKLKMSGNSKSHMRCWNDFKKPWKELQIFH